METKVAVFGGADFVMPFSAMGLDTYPVESDKEQVEKTAKKIIKKSYGLIVVAENTAKLAEEVFEPLQKKTVPCIVTIPFMQESDGFATRSLSRTLKLATGIDILASN